MSGLTEKTTAIMRAVCHRDVMRRRTLVDSLARDISRADDRGPDWVTAVEDAVLRQDMDWLTEGRQPADSAGRPRV